MNDYDPLFLGVVLLVSLIVVGNIGYLVYNYAQPTVTRKARLTGKRKTLGKSTASCTFEFEDGQRREYDISMDTYASLAPNDVGFLDTKGALFRGFRVEGDGPPSSPFMNASLRSKSLARVREALIGGRKIEAIKLYRDRTGAGLIEAKAAVEQLEAELRAAGPHGVYKAGD